MSGLSYICEYDDDDDDEDTVSDENDNNYDKKEDCPKTRLPQPNLSGISVVSFDEHLDNSDVHGGRVRTFPHVRGNWATFLYIEYPDKENLFKAIDKLLKLVATIDSTCCKCEDIHISLSKTFVLKYHMINLFTKSLQETLNNVERKASSNCQYTIIMMAADQGTEGKCETFLQSSLGYLEHSNDITAGTTADNSGVETDAAVTYFVDEEGHYYYQPSIVSLVSLPTEELNNEELPEAQIIMEGDGYQTVTLVPSNNEIAYDTSYVLVMQGNTGPLINNDININENSSHMDKCEEKELDCAPAKEASDDHHTGKNKRASPKKRNKHFRPQYPCNFCSYTNQKRYLLLRHMKKHSEEKPHKCNVCERGFKTVGSLQNHVNMHNGVKPHLCKYCKSSFTTSGELVRHIRYRHTHEKPHKCTECDYASVELSKLKRHVRCHTGERPYQCPHCTYASQDTFKLKRHVRTHTGEKPYKCDYCNLRFTQSNSLKAHKLIHGISEKRLFSCELCPAKCGRKSDLRLHVQKLHTDKILNCKQCDKSSPDRYSCKIHNKTHEGEKCFKCKLCSYASTSSLQLKTHMLKHMNGKRFFCDQCDQSFRQKQLLRCHIILNHKRDYKLKSPKEKTHICHECDRPFAHKRNLIRHLAIHDRELDTHESELAQLGCQTEPNININDSNNHTEEMMQLDLGVNQVERGMTVADDHGQQYVVLEVLQTANGTEQQLAVIPSVEYLEGEKKNDHLEINQQEIPVKLDTAINYLNDVNNCFEFGEKEVLDADKYISFNENIVLHLV